MKLLLKLSLAGCVLSGLSACGSSGGADAPTLRAEFETAAASAVAINDRLNARLPTTALNMPDAGAVTYTGAAGVVVETATTTTFLVGDGRVDADFSTDTLTGTMSNFIGVSGPLADDPDPAILDTAAAYAGTLNVTNGVIGSIVASGIDADFSGTLTGAGNVITMDGTMFGQFFGNPGIVGLLLDSSDATTTTTLNGIAATGFAGISAER